MERTMATAVIAIGYLVASLFLGVASSWFGVKVTLLIASWQALPG